MEELRSEGRLQRLIEERVIERFLECGDPHHGFARIYCPIPFRGTATRRETEELLDEGIAVMSLPVPPQSDWH